MTFPLRTELCARPCLRVMAARIITRITVLRLAAALVATTVWVIAPANEAPAFAQGANQQSPQAIDMASSEGTAVLSSPGISVPSPRLDAYQPPQTTNSQAQTGPVLQTQAAPARSALDRRDEIFYPGDTENVKPLARKLALNILLDEKDFFFSPFRMSRSDAKWWLGGAAIAAVLIAEDKRIANSLENSRGQVAWGGRISQIGAPYTIVPVIAGYYILGVVVDHAKAREIGVLGTESVLDSLILVEVLKQIARRDRPDEAHPGNFWAGGQSFPSGHAIQTWALASLIAHEYKQRPYVAVIAYGLAATIGASRIAARQHFASDVFVGGAMGWFIGRYVYNTHMSHLAHKHASLMPLIVPQYQAASRSYGVTLVFSPGGWSDASRK